MDQIPNQRLKWYNYLSNLINNWRDNMTVTKNFAAPTGSGLSKFVAPHALREASDRGGKLTIIVAVAEMKEQWSRLLPGVEVLTGLEWLKRANDSENDLIVVGELHDHIRRRIAATLQAVPCDVWTLNAPVSLDFPEYIGALASSQLPFAASNQI